MQILHSVGVQILHFLDRQILHSGCQSADFSFWREGKNCLQARVKFLHAARNEDFAFWPECIFCIQVRGKQKTNNNIAYRLIVLWGDCLLLKAGIIILSMLV